ncbi:MAG: MFS transporter [Hyphomicrobiales bacterium]
MSRTEVRLSDASGWRSPANALIVMSAANYLSFATWNALHTNFAINVLGFNGTQIGILHTVREIPGFLSFAAVFFLHIMREQTLGLLSLLLIGGGVAITGFFPTAIGFYVTTVIKSLGFHYYETVAQSLSLQWFEKREAPRLLGRVIAATSFATIASYALIFLFWDWLRLDYFWLFVAGGVGTLLMAAFVWLAFPSFKEEVPQHKKLILRSRYWLYYALVFMGGARRQIFVVFAAFLMVQKFNYGVGAMTLLLLVNAVFNTLLAPKIGQMIGNWGDRKSMLVEHAGLVIVFLLYAVVHDPWIAAVLYILDNAFFSFSIAQKTYFQKIAAPADIAPTSGVAFSINHIAAVGLPIPLGIVWDFSPPAVFLFGAAMAGVAFLLSLLVPHDPAPGYETTLQTKPVAAPAE